MSVKIQKNGVLVTIANAFSALASKVFYDNTISGMTATNVQDAIDECFQSVSNGKSLVASAITDKGVTTASDATFATMATNIENIVTGITPSGNKSITISDVGTTSDIDVNDYATASVTTSGLVKPSGTKSITSNGTSINVESYKYVNVAIPKLSSYSVLKETGGTAGWTTVYLTKDYDVLIVTRWNGSGTPSISYSGSVSSNIGVSYQGVWIIFNYKAYTNIQTYGDVYAGTGSQVIGLT